MSMTDTIFGRRKLAVVDDVYIRNGSGSNIGAQTYNIYQYIHNQLSVPLEKKHIPITSLHVRLLRKIQYTKKSKTKLNL